MATDGESRKDKISKRFLHNVWERHGEGQNGGGALGAGAVLHLGRDAWLMIKRLRQARNIYAPTSPS